MQPSSTVSSGSQKIWVDIIIPHYGSGRPTQLALKCLRSIRENSVAGTYRLILVDNASPEYELLLPELGKFSDFLLFRNLENLGFIKAVNQGLRASSAPFVVLMNNDTEAVSEWLEALRVGFHKHPSVGLVGPRTTTPESWQGRWPGRGGPKVLGTHAMLAFFCVMIKREVIEKCGLLDEDFGIGFGDDDMYCWRAQRAGFQLVIQQDLLIPHHHRSTFRSMFTEQQIKAMQTEALAKFHQKCKMEDAR